MFGKLLDYLRLPFSRSETQTRQSSAVDGMEDGAIKSKLKDLVDKGYRVEIDDGGNVCIEITKEQWEQPIKDEYLLRISKMSADELYDGYNPGPLKPDGSVNFECHCVGHLVASPCGYAFRDAITCQKSASDEELEKGACADEFIEFMNCVDRTKCFRARKDKEKSIDDDEDVLKVPVTAPPPDK